MQHPKVQEAAAPLGTRVIASPEVVRFIRERGGRLFIQADRHRCCGGSGVVLLDATTEPPVGGSFLRLEADGFELLLDLSIGQVPDELSIVLRGRRRRRLEAFW
ncbi:MAG: hypothetical protein DLM70_17450, partial [Chloroflexi bacterium]